MLFRLVTNHSNAKVSISMTYQKPSTTNGSAKLGFSSSSFTLATAENTTVSNAPKKKVTITASGAPTANGSIGTIVVSVNTAT